MATKTKQVEKPQEAVSKQNCVRTTQDDVTFEVIATDILGMLPWATYQPIESTNEKFAELIEQKNLRDMVGCFTKSMAGIKRFQQDWNELLDATAEAFVWKGSGDSSLSLYQNLLEAVKASMPRPPLETADPLSAELMIGGTVGVHKALGSALHDTVSRMTGAWRAGLEQMREAQMVGRQDWLSPSVVKYSFHRMRRVERRDAPSIRTETKRFEDSYFGEFHEEETTYRVQSVGRFDLLERHEHHLFNAKRHQFPAPALKKPVFVETFGKHVKEWIGRHVFMAEGDMCREDVTTQEREIERFNEERVLSNRIVRSGSLWSPSVAIGTFVLTGWSTSDLA